MNFDIVILADGDFPSHALPLKVLKEAKVLVCCDNAGRALIAQRGITPTAIVGDGDSLPSEFKEKYSHIYHQVDEQDYNDLTKATRFAIELLKDMPRQNTTSAPEASHSDMPTMPRIAYLGCTGQREDHTIGNISLMNFYRKEFGICPVMITDYGTFTTHQGDITIDTFPRQQVSIFNMDSRVMSSEGLKWQISAYDQWWQGTLNEALGTQVTIHADASYIIYRTHEPK